MSQPKRYYVYTLSGPDNKVFYVGKGQRNRVFQHEVEASKGCRCHKCNKIRKIWRGGDQIMKHYVFDTNDESEAYKYEEQLIFEIGISNLCNKALGGRGNTSITDEEIDHRLWAVQEYEYQKQQEKQRESAQLGWWLKQENLAKTRAKNKS